MGLPRSTPTSTLVEHAIVQLENLLQQQTAPEDTAAIFLEPVIGEGGYIPAPPKYIQHLRKLCDKHGIMLVIDEIQTGFCRTGKTFAIEHSGVRPDLLVYAKGFANGMPISGIVSRKEVMAAMPAGSLGGTYSGNVVACAAALATTTYMRTHDVLGNVQARSKQVFEGLKRIQESEDGWIIEEVRGQGVSLRFPTLHLAGSPPNVLSMRRPTLSNTDETADGRHRVQRPFLPPHLVQHPLCHPPAQPQQGSARRMHDPRLVDAHHVHLPRAAHDPGADCQRGRGG